MELHRALGVLSDVVAQLEDGRSIRAIETVVPADEEYVRATIEVPVSLCRAEESGTVSPSAVAVTSDGQLEVTFPSADDLLPTIERACVTVTERHVTVTESDLVARLTILVTPPDWGSAGGKAAAGVTAQTDGERSDRADASPTGPDVGPTGTATDDGPTGTATDDGPTGTATGDGPTGTATGDGPTGTATDDGPTGTATGDGGNWSRTDRAGGPDESSATGSGEIEAQETGAGRAGQPETGDAATESERPAEPDPLADARDPSVPPFEDESYLEALYESFDTFEAMRDAIEMDVSAETVRRYMIETGIHVPTRYDTGGPGEADSERKSVVDGASPDGASEEGPTHLPPAPELVADGEDLPSDLEMTDVVEAVVDARSVYEVTRELEIEFSEARDLLRDLDLLDLVSVRLAEAGNHETTYEAVTARLRNGSPEVA